MKESKIEKPKVKEEGTKDLVETIQERRLDALPYIVDKLEIDSRRSEFDCISPESLPEQVDYSKIENVVWSLLEREKYIEKKEKYTEIINAIAELYKDADKNNEKFQGWSHSLCHLFEGYNPGYPHYRSLLEPRFLKTAEKLVNECISRGLEANNAGCMDRVIHPIIRYNLANIKTKEDLERRYDFKPAVLTKQKGELINLLDKEDDGGQIESFLITSTPKEYILKRIKCGQKLFYGYPERTEKITVEMLNLVKEYLSEDEINSYLKEAYNINIRDIGGKNLAEDLAIIRKNLEQSEKASERVKGLFIDVEGTLVINGQLNEELLERIEEESKEGKDIIIFTGGDPEEQTELLRKLGFPEKYLPVKEKKDYKRKVLETLIDDTDPVYQGFKCVGRSGWRWQPKK